MSTTYGLSKNADVIRFLLYKYQRFLILYYKPINTEIFNKFNCHIFKIVEQTVLVGIYNRKLKLKTSGHTDMMQISAVVFVPGEAYKILTAKTRSYYSGETK